MSLERLARRVRLMVGRAVLNLVNDAAGLQTLQVSALADETRDGVERVQNYGMTSVPLAGATVVMVSVAGVRDHLVAVAVDDPRYRPQDLAPGEVCIYTDEGDKIHLKRGKLIEITTNTLKINAATKVEMNTPLITSTGQLKTDGNITDLAQTNTRTVAGMRAQYNNHVHGGVQAGSSNTSTTATGM